MIVCVHIRVRTWPGGKRPTLKDAMVLDIGIGVVPMLTVEVQEDSWDYIVTARLQYSLSEGRYLATSVEVSTSMLVHLNDDKTPRKNRVIEVTSVLLRKVRIAEIVRLGASGGIFTQMNRDEPPVSQLDWYGTVGEIRWGSPFSDLIREMGPVESNLHNVGVSYTLAKMSGDAPAKAVERQFGLPSRTAADWIARAKAAGKIRNPEDAKVLTWPTEDLGDAAELEED